VHAASCPNESVLSQLPKCTQKPRAKTAEPGSLIADSSLNPLPNVIEPQSETGKLGEGAAHLFEQALEGGGRMWSCDPPPEALVRQLEANSVRSFQNHRAVAALEWIWHARRSGLDGDMAAGAPAHRLTVEARGALSGNTALAQFAPQRMEREIDTFDAIIWDAMMILMAMCNTLCLARVAKEEVEEFSRTRQADLSRS